MEGGRDDDGDLGGDLQAVDEAVVVGVHGPATEIGLLQGHLARVVDGFVFRPLVYEVLGNGLGDELVQAVIRKAKDLPDVPQEGDTGRAVLVYASVRVCH